MDVWHSQSDEHPEPVRTDPGGAYLAAEILTATPSQLAVVLYDGAIRCCRQALEALDSGETDLAGEKLSAARATVRHLHGRVQVGTGELARQLDELYASVHRQLVEADFYRRREAVTESISLLRFRRSAWADFARAACPMGDAPCHCSSPDAGWVG